MRWFHRNFTEAEARMLLSLMYCSGRGLEGSLQKHQVTSSENSKPGGESKAAPGPLMYI